jgi:hypothetical protein
LVEIAPGVPELCSNIQTHTSIFIYVDDNKVVNERGTDDGMTNGRGNRVRNYEGLK